MTGCEADVPSSVELRAVIVRACNRCGGPRQLGVPCGQCGNRQPPDVQDAGIIAASYKDPVKMQRWLSIGQHIAARIAQEVNRGNHGRGH
jgi:hypothetical protein